MKLYPIHSRILSFIDRSCSRNDVPRNEYRRVENGRANKFIAFFSEVLWRISIFPTYLCKLSSFFLEPFTNHIEIWRRFVGGIRRIQYFSTYHDATPAALPPLSLLDFHRTHLGGLSVILSCRQLQTRRPITVSIEGVWTKARRQFLAAKLRVNVSILFSFLFNSR